MNKNYLIYFVSYYTRFFFRKWKDIIQDTKQRIKDLKSELKSSEHCEVTGKRFM